jgi:hypothetical protein
MRPRRSEGSKLARHFRMPGPSKLSIAVGGGLLCAVTALSLTAATWPAASPAAFTGEATADLAIVNHQQQSLAKSASLATGAADVLGGKAAAASRVHEIQITQMRATAARLHAAHLAVLAKRAEQARQAAAARAAAAKAAAAKAAAAKSAAARAAAAKSAAARAAAAKSAAAKSAAAKAAKQSSSTSSSSAGPSSPLSAPSGSPRQIAQQILASQGRSGQFSCLDSLWVQESGWNVYAQNPGSGAYGIPQALPGSKMASAGPDWQTNAATQIRWGLSYIDSTYGSPCAAWSHEQSAGWY